MKHTDHSSGFAGAWIDVPRSELQAKRTFAIKR